MERVLENTSAGAANHSGHVDGQGRLVELIVEFDLLLLDEGRDRFDVVQALPVDLARDHIAFVKQEHRVSCHLTQD